MLVASVVVISCLATAARCRAFSSEAGEFVLAGATISGNQNLSPEDLLRGLDLKVGSSVTKKTLQQTCEKIDGLRLFYSEKCSVRIDGSNLWIDLKVTPVAGPPLIFENFVWTTRKALLARLKQEIPLFTPEIPENSGIDPDIIRVLDKVIAERGVQGHAVVDTFWAQRGGGGHVFAIAGIQVPVVSCVITGEDAPSQEEVNKAVPGCVRENFEMPLLSWIAEEIVGSLYTSRGYLHPVVEEPIVQFRGEKDGKFPVRVVFPISPGPQYKFKSVSFEGAARKHSAELLAQWQLKPGDVYNTAYISDFELNQILNQPWAQSTRSSSYVDSCEHVDEISKTVSLTLTAKPPKKWRTISPDTQRDCGGTAYFSFVGERFETAPTGM